MDAREIVLYGNDPHSLSNQTLEHIAAPFQVLRRIGQAKWLSTRFIYTNTVSQVIPSTAIVCAFLPSIVRLHSHAFREALLIVPPSIRSFYNYVRPS